MAGVSDGVPLMVAEVATGLVDSGMLVRERGGWRTTGALGGGPPPSHSALVEGRVAALAPGVRELVRTAAVLGPELDPRRLAAVSAGATVSSKRCGPRWTPACWSAIRPVNCGGGTR